MKLLITLITFLVASVSIASVPARHSFETWDDFHQFTATHGITEDRVDYAEVDHVWDTTAAVFRETVKNQFGDICRVDGYIPVYESFEISVQRKLRRYQVHSHDAGVTSMWSHGRGIWLNRKRLVNEVDAFIYCVRFL